MWTSVCCKPGRCDILQTFDDACVDGITSACMNICHSQGNVAEIHDDIHTSVFDMVTFYIQIQGRVD